jgi:hypothetical protein
MNNGNNKHDFTFPVEEKSFLNKVSDRINIFLEKKMAKIGYFVIYLEERENILLKCQNQFSFKKNKNE